MQPSQIFFFKGRKSLIGVELKIGAKSSLEQVMKYAILFHFHQEHHKQEMETHLVFMGKGPFQNLFKERYGSFNEIKENIKIEMLPEITKKGKINLQPHKNKIFQIAQDMSISFINYQMFSELLEKLKKNVDSTSEYSDTVLKLIDGILNEFFIRNLAVPNNIDNKRNKIKDQKSRKFL